MPVPTLITELSTTISSNSPAGSDVVTPSTGPDDYMRAQSAFIAQLHSLKATIASPTFTGVPAGPTASAGTNTTQLATTAFAQGAGFPTGTRMIFQQTAAPTGWTKDTTGSLNDSALRIVTGSVVNGGTAGFAATFASRTPTGTNAGHVLTTAESPAHTHFVVAPESIVGNVTLTNTNYFGDYTPGTSNNTRPSHAGVNTVASTGLSSSTGGGGSHTHTFTGSAMDFAVRYHDCIIASKD